MKTGSFFTMGSTHLVCEDYALNGENYVILSDGCSNGGGPRIHTDWGSRLLCKAAEQHISLLPDDREAFNNRCIATAAAQTLSIPGLPKECLTATLMAAVARYDEIWVHLVGDGVFGAKFKGSNDFVINEFKFESEAPYYLRYELDAKDRESYFKQFGTKVKQTLWSGDLSTPSSHNVNHEVNHDVSECPFFCGQFRISDFDFVFIASDGVGSFYKTETRKTSRQNVRISVPEVIETLLDFKSFNNDFVERQCQWVFKTNKTGSFAKNNIGHADDVSLGVIYCG